MPEKKRKLVLVDTNALMHRAYHALPPLTTKKGEVVNAVYGFTSILLKILKELAPDYIVCAFDMAAPTFRHVEFEDYKAHRVKAPDEFYSQIPKIKEVIAAFGIPIYEKEGFEADDIIGTIAFQAPKMFEGADYEIVILTGDLDTLQLVNSHVKVCTFKKGINDTAIYDEKAVEQRYGLKPKQMIDFKGLRGDPSDNIPGVPGVGEKTAGALLKEFESIDTIYKNFDKAKEKIKPNIAKKLEEFKEQVYFSKYLASIRPDAPIEFNLIQSAKKDFNRQRLAKLFQELEFFSLIRRLDNGAGNGKPPASPQLQRGEPEEAAVSNGYDKFEFKTIKSREEIKELADYIKNQGQFSFAADYRFLNSEYELLKLGMAAGEKAREIIFSQFGGEEKKEINKILKDIFEDATLEKIGHNLKNGIRVFNGLGIDLAFTPPARLAGAVAKRAGGFDTMAAAYLLSPGKRNYSLEKIFFEKTGEEIPKDGAGKTAAAILILAKILKTELEKNKMASLAKQIEFPLIEVLANMEAKGVKIDTERLKSLSLKIGGKIEELRKKIFALCGEEFNINSTRELSRILFEKLKIPAKGVKKTKTDYSTAADTLEQIKFLHPVAPLISQYRELAKIKSTYADALPKLISPKTGRIHTTFNQVLTATGRLSSSDPNLQNIPTKTDIGNEIRMAFVPENKNWLLLSLDYSQIELRIVASMANDEKMLALFATGGDIHTETAAEIQGVAPEQVTERMRNAAKALNFGIIYGMSSHGFSQATGMPREEAQDFIDRYLARFYGVSRFIEEVKESAKKKGYAETIFGRRRWLPELNSPNFQVRSAAERMAINMPIQGTAADIIKLAMIAIDKKYKGDKNINLILQVHDELVFEVKKENPPARFAGASARRAGGAAYAEEIKKIMENVYMLKAPLKASASIGENWGEMSAL